MNQGLRVDSFEAITLKEKVINNIKNVFCHFWARLIL